MQLKKARSEEGEWGCPDALVELQRASVRPEVSFQVMNLSIDTYHKIPSTRAKLAASLVSQAPRFPEQIGQDSELPQLQAKWGLKMRPPWWTETEVHLESKLFRSQKGKRVEGGETQRQPHNRLASISLCEYQDPECLISLVCAVSQAAYRCDVLLPRFW